MTKNSQISSIVAREIFDSRGRPTVEADVHLADGTMARAAAPSGASTGRHEAWELRDCDDRRHEGFGVLRAVANVNERIAPRLKGFDALDQAGLDAALIDLDGSARLDTLGSNGVLPVSLAVSRAAATSSGTALHVYLHSIIGERPMSIPMPMTNILSGGAHAGRAMDIQDFLVIPVGATSFAEALDHISRVRNAAAGIMAKDGLTTLLADEGGLSPGFASARKALDLMVRSFEAAGLRPGTDVAIALDVAASELHSNEGYAIAGRQLPAEAMTDFLVGLVRDYPIISIEDALEQDDWPGWTAAKRKLGHIQLVGDDLFATNVGLIERGIAERAANAVLIKVNQNGTLSGTINALHTAWAGGFATIVSARSGETEDSYIADLAVGSGTRQIKIGSVRNSERMAKYNQLIRLDEGRLPFATWNDTFSHLSAVALEQI